MAPRSLTLLALAGAFAGAAMPISQSFAEEGAADLRSALTDGDFSLSLRLRYEFVDHDAFAKNANALTARAAFTYQTKAYRDFTALLGVQATQRLSEQRYTNPVSPQPGFPPVVDPDGGNINLAWLRYDGIEDLSITLGRQRIIHDNARFIGNVGWRQSEQTFDALRLQWSGLEGLDAEASYLSAINTITLGREYLHGGIGRVAYKVKEIGLQAVAFGHYLDYHSADALDTLTLGLMLHGSVSIDDDFSVLYRLGAAWQGDIADNPNDISETWWQAEVGVAWQRLQLKLGLESFSGDGTVAFQTPLATKHAFNGWADLFLNTPAHGLNDYYVSIGGPISAVPGLGVLAAFHLYANNSSASGQDSQTYGREFNLQTTYALRQFDQRLVFGGKVAAYRAADFASDVTKLWLWTQYSF